MSPMEPTELEDVNDLTYPVLVSPTFRGARVTIMNGQAKGVENRAVLEMLSGLPNFDGIVVGDDIDKPGGAPDFTFWVMDVMTRTGMPFNQRLDIARSFVNASGNYVKVMPYKMVKSPDGLLSAFAAYEYIMIRDPATLGSEFYYMEVDDVEEDVPLRPDGDDERLGDSQ